MSNMIKGGFVYVDNSEKKVIDNNEIINKKLEELREKMAEAEKADPEFEEGFVEGLDPVKLAQLVSDNEEEGAAPLFSDDPEAEGFEENLFAGANVIKADKSLEEVSSEARIILEKAREEAGVIKANAEAAGYEEGHAKGYDDGVRDAVAEYEQKAAQIAEDCQNEIEAVKAQYENLKANLEPQLVEKITDIYEKVLGISLQGDKEAVMLLLEHALSGMESGRNYLVHISREDFENVSGRKMELSVETGIPADLLELIEDNTLPANGCLIECEGGIFDCGLGTQLSLLKKQLKILSLQ